MANMLQLKAEQQRVKVVEKLRFNFILMWLKSKCFDIAVLVFPSISWSWRWKATGRRAQHTFWLQKVRCDHASEALHYFLELVGRVFLGVHLFQSIVKLETNVISIVRVDRFAVHSHHMAQLASTCLWYCSIALWLWVLETTCSTVSRLL